MSEQQKMADLTAFSTTLQEALDLPIVLDEQTLELILRLASDAAHHVVRPAAPVATFAAGLLIGQSIAAMTDSMDGQDMLDELIGAVQEQAVNWNNDTE